MEVRMKGPNIDRRRDVDWCLEDATMWARTSDGKRRTAAHEARWAKRKTRRMARRAAASELAAELCELAASNCQPWQPQPTLATLATVWVTGIGFVDINNKLAA
jgi:hypothetical protein